MWNTPRQPATMSSILNSVVILIVAGILPPIVDAQGSSTMMLEKFAVCGDVPNEVVFFIVPRNFHRGRQAVYMNLSSPYPLGDNVVVKLKLEKESPIANSWIPLIHFDVKQGFCVALDRFMGEFGYAIEIAVGLPSKVCPVPKGKYQTDNFVMDFSTLRLPVMPSGRTKVIVELFHKQKQKLVHCSEYILSNL